VFEEFPYHQSILHSAEAVTEQLPGFADDISECRKIADLPAAAREYLDFVSDFVGVPVKLVGVGPGRDQVIWADGERPLRAVA
jgi:adenylosuccinate synthase